MSEREPVIHRSGTLTIPVEDVRAEVDRIVAKHGLSLTREDLLGNRAPFAARYVVRRPSDDLFLIGVAFREGEDDDAITQVWELFVKWGVL